MLNLRKISKKVGNTIRITTRAIVSNSDMIKNYKTCREKAEELGKIYILKNNQPDAVLFSVAEYERLSAIIEHLESLQEKELIEIIESFPHQGKRSTYAIESLRHDINPSEQ
jgi:PHD/YefM family antitoxin component YafN of YafNO toxin-antitoxin module